MIRRIITNEMINMLMSIERAKENFGAIKVPMLWANRLRKSSKKKSSYASNYIEGNPLTEEQADAVLSDPSKRHYLILQIKELANRP